MPDDALGSLAVDPAKPALDCPCLDDDGIHRSFKSVVAGIMDEKKDYLGEPVLRIYEYTNRYVIYSVSNCEDGPGFIRYYIGGANAAEERGKIAAIASKLSNLNDLIGQMKSFNGRRAEGYDALKERAMSVWADALQQALEGRTAEAEAMIGAITAEIESKRDSITRMKYVVASVIAITIVSALWLLVTPSINLGPWFADLKSGFNAKSNVPLVGSIRIPVVNMIFLGALGSFLSVLLGIRSIKINYSASYGEMLFSGYSRIVIGMIGSIVVLLLLNGHWVLESMKPETKLWNYYLLAFIAGFSEWFVPNLLRGVESGLAARDPAKGKAAAAH